jgi:hypothetical protein
MGRIFDIENILHNIISMYKELSVMERTVHHGSLDDLRGGTRSQLERHQSMVNLTNLEIPASAPSPPVPAQDPTPTSSVAETNQVNVSFAFRLFHVHKVIKEMYSKNQNVVI